MTLRKAARRLLGLLSEIDDLRVEEFSREGFGEGVDGGLLLGGERAQALGGAGELGLAEGFSALLQRDDCGNCFAGLQVFVVLLNLCGDDFFGCG